jgi:hypothetical protein
MGEPSDTGHLTEKPEKFTSFAAPPPMKRQEGVVAFYRTRGTSGGSAAPPQGVL